MAAKVRTGIGDPGNCGIRATLPPNRIVVCCKIRPALLRMQFRYRTLHLKKRLKVLLGASQKNTMINWIINMIIAAVNEPKSLIDLSIVFEFSTQVRFFVLRLNTIQNIMVYGI
jgi:hypothetical protein